MTGDADAAYVAARAVLLDALAALESHIEALVQVRVAGPAALLVAKLHKLAERNDDPSRTDRKDALDIYRLLSLNSADVADRMGRLLADETTTGVATQAIGHLKHLFGSVEAFGCMLAGESVSGLMDPFEMQQSTQILAGELLALLSP